MEMSSTQGHKERSVGFAASPSVESYERDEESDLEAATTASISEEGEEVDEEDEDEDDQNGADAGTPRKRKRKKVGDETRHTMYNMPARRARFVPVRLCFENLFYSVHTRESKNPFRKKHKKTLLKDLHGELRPGEVTAIMGPSGIVFLKSPLLRPTRMP
jgi:ABC-type multidrug transport system fused ATPase/permease subunit